MDECALVGKQEETAGVLVESSDGGDLRIARAPTRWQEVVHAWAFALVVGADEAGGLVQEEEQAERVIGGFTIDAYVGRVGFEAGVVGRLAADGHAPGVNPRAGLAAGTIAEVGKDLVETTHGLKAVQDGRERKYEPEPPLGEIPNAKHPHFKE